MRTSSSRVFRRLCGYLNPHGRSKRKGLAIALSAGLGAVAAMSWSAPPTGAADASSLTLLGFAGSDALYNYDFLSETVSSSNTDWTANMMFRNNANINKVKDILRPDFQNSGNAEHAYLKDDSTYVWDSDTGMKNPGPSCPQDIHMRLYAPSDDQMFNLTDGFYIFGTTHWDWKEGCTGEMYGWSQNAEYTFAGIFINKGYSVSRDCCYWYNYESLRYQGRHVWDNNGYTSIVNIP